MRVIGRLNDWVSEMPGVDLVLSLVVAGLASWRTGVPSELTLGERLTIYGTAGTVIAVIGGLGSIAVSVYLGGKGGRVTLLRAENGSALRANWRMTLIATALTAMACWAAQVVDASGYTKMAWFMMLASFVWALTAFFRLVWLFNRLMQIAEADERDEARPAGELSARWRGGTA
jgi:hypothetical protein